MGYRTAQLLEIKRVFLIRPKQRHRNSDLRYPLHDALAAQLPPRRQLKLFGLVAVYVENAARNQVDALGEQLGERARVPLKKV